MKTQVVELNQSDSLSSIVERIIESETIRVILVDQQGNDFLQNELTLRLLFRQTKNAGKQLCIITVKSLLTQLCSDNSFPVFEDIKQVETAEWIVANSTQFRSVPGTKVSRDELKTPIRQANFAPLGHTGFSFILFAISILTILAVLVTLLPSARILVSSDKVTTIENIPVLVMPDYNGTDLYSMISGEKRDITVEAVDSMTILSRKEIPTKSAVGEVVITNQTNTSVVYPTMTEVRVISDPSKRFLIQTDVRLDGIIGSVVTVPVTALEPGEIGNIPENSQLEIVSTMPGIVSVSNPNPITGGRKEITTTASVEDRNSLRSLVI